MTLRQIFLLGLTAAIARAEPHWAFQPLHAVTPPEAAGVVSEVDRFLAAAGRSPAPPAEKRTLLRRATYDLTGLPPTAAEMEAFLADASPEAFAKAVDRLLGSPAYGEKWGRAWLDVVRYADTAGETADVPMPHAWRYRNWVIKAFNDDLPADEFIRWQIAGDLLAADGPAEQAADKTVATGFLGVARRFGFNIEQDIHLTYEDTIDTMGKAFMGLSLGCARCHDHKYDPVSARDYYGLYGIFESTRLPFTGCEKSPRPRDMVPLPTPEFVKLREAWKVGAGAADAALKTSETALAGLAGEFAGSVPIKVAEGTLTPSAAATWPPDGTAGTLTIAQGEMLQLTILPRADFGGDATGVEWTISETEGEKRQWELCGALADPAKPQPGWQVLDVEREPRLCLHFDGEFEKTPGMAAWRGGELWPSVLINTGAEPLKFQTLTMPPRSVALHPGPRGGIAIVWQSPLAGSVRVRLKVAEIDPGGDGVDWKLERRPSLSSVLERQRPLMTAQLAAVNSKREWAAKEPQPLLALAVADAKPVNARLQKKGEPKDPGAEVPRKVLDLFGGAVIPPGAGSGRRELADWLTRREARNLTARVMVNRLWLGHFGEGLVSTPNDFGTRGAPPSDPALLDWLASRFMAEKWSIKAMHRRLMLTSAYQQTSATEGNDRGFPRRRLTAEELRDTLLLLGGNLDSAPGGSHPFPPEGSWGFTQHTPFSAVYETNKRSVYLMVQRTRRHPFLALFDGGDPNASTPVRSQSTVPTQALYFLNDPFVHAQAKAMATRLVKAAPDNDARMDLAARELYGRPATEDERAVMAAFLESTSGSIPSLSEPARTAEVWSAWLRVLLGTNELLYVD
jgi:hypothetical protein